MATQTDLKCGVCGYRQRSNAKMYQFYPLPADLDRRHRWFEILKIDGNQIDVENFKVCGRHFHVKFFNRCILPKNVNPESKRKIRNRKVAEAIVVRLDSESSDGEDMTSKPSLPVNASSVRAAVSSPITTIASSSSSYQPHPASSTVIQYQVHQADLQRTRSTSRRKENPLGVRPQHQSIEKISPASTIPFEKEITVRKSTPVQLMIGNTTISQNQQPTAIDPSTEQFPTNQATNSDSDLDHQQQLELYCYRLTNGDRQLLNSSVRCRLCSLSIPVLQNETIRMNQCVDHARIHSRITAFSCSICGHRSALQKWIVLHLEKVHYKSGRDSTDWNDSTKDFKKEIMQFIDQCFAETRSVCTGRDELSLLIYCQSAIDVDRVENDTIKCAVCRIEIAAGGCVSKIFEHAVFHLPMVFKRLFCRLCEFSATTLSQFEHHHHRVHPNFRNVDISVNYLKRHRNEVEAIIDYCFGSSDSQERARYFLPTWYVEELEFGQKNSIDVQCLNILDRYPEAIWIICRLCQRPVKIRFAATGNALPNNAVDHALEHIGIPMYWCRLCTKSDLTAAVIREHIRIQHPSASASQRPLYDCYLFKYRKQITSTLSQCFCVERKIIDHHTRIARVKDQLRRSIFKFTCDICGFSTIDKKRIVNHAGKAHRKRKERKLDWTKMPQLMPSGKIGKKRKTKMEKFFGHSTKTVTIGFEVKFHWNGRIPFKCPHCSFSSKMRKLVINHMKLMH